MKLRLRTTRKEKEEPVVDIWLEEPDNQGDVCFFAGVNGSRIRIAWIDTSEGKFHMAYLESDEVFSLREAGFTIKDGRIELN